MSQRRARRTRPVLALAAAAALVLSGCGSATPNAAVVVNGAQVSMDAVDALVNTICATPEVTGGQSAPRRQQRAQVAQWVALDEMADQFAEANDLTTPAEFTKKVNEQASTLETTFGSDAAELARISMAAQRLNELVAVAGTQVLASQGKPTTDPQVVGEAGGQVFTDWLDGQDVSFDPRLDLELKDNQFVVTQGAGSVAVSDIATGGSTPAAPGQTAPVAELGANQICG